MDKIEKMRDGTEVTVRLLVPQDIDRSMELSASLPGKDRKYQQADVVDLKAAVKRLRRVDTGATGSGAATRPRFPLKVSRLSCKVLP